MMTQWSRFFYTLFEMPAEGRTSRTAFNKKYENPPIPLSPFQETQRGKKRSESRDCMNTSYSAESLSGDSAGKKVTMRKKNESG